MSKTLFFGESTPTRDVGVGLTYSALEHRDLMGLYRLCKESNRKTSVPVCATSPGQMNNRRVAGGFPIDPY